MTKRLPWVLAALLLLLLAWVLLVWEPIADLDGPDPGPVLVPAPKGGNFTLQSAAGAVSLEDFRGKVVLLFFGYTWCPDVCPTNLGFITLALEKLKPAEREQVQVLFVSVDPERDTPQRLAEYTRFFAPDILGITGTAEQIAKTAALFGAAYRRVEAAESAAGYVIDHSSLTYLIDPRGRLDRILDHATIPGRIVSAVRVLLPLGDAS